LFIGTRAVGTFSVPADSQIEAAKQLATLRKQMFADIQATIEKERAAALEVEQAKAAEVNKLQEETVRCPGLCVPVLERVRMPQTSFRRKEECVGTTCLFVELAIAIR
jgi:hypothetical protein